MELRRADLPQMQEQFLRADRETPNQLPARDRWWLLSPIQASGGPVFLAGHEILTSEDCDAFGPGFHLA